MKYPTVRKYVILGFIVITKDDPIPVPTKSGKTPPVVWKLWGMPFFKRYQ